MSLRSHSRKREVRKKEKQADSQRVHVDKYADQSMQDKLRRLADRFNGGRS